MGIGPDLMDGARAAVRDTIAWLVEGARADPGGRLHDLQSRRRSEVVEVVDGGMWNVGFTLPLTILRDDG